MEEYTQLQKTGRFMALSCTHGNLMDETAFAYFMKEKKLGSEHRLRLRAYMSHTQLIACRFWLGLGPGLRRKFMASWLSGSVVLTVGPHTRLDSAHELAARHRSSGPAIQ